MLLVNLCLYKFEMPKILSGCFAFIDPEFCRAILDPKERKEHVLYQPIFLKIF